MKVSVSLITYNQEGFISQAINSMLMQQVNFDYEIVIGEDCSTDNTRDIVIGFQKRYPERIRLLLPERNLGASRNRVQTLRACRGEYVALLDGDDYWTSPHKLQRQVDFLDSHPECAICFHDLIMFFEDGSREPRNYCSADLKEVLTIEDLVVKSYILPVSAMFRNGLVYEKPEEFRKLIIGDWPRFVLIAQYGKVGYINEVMGAYRVHSGGAFTRGGGWSSVNNRIRMDTAEIECYEAINEYFGHKYYDLIRSEIAHFSYSLARAYSQQGNWKSMRRYLLKGFFAQPFNDKPFSFLVKNLLISFFPGAYRRYCYLRGQRKKPKLGI